MIYLLWLKIAYVLFSITENMVVYYTIHTHICISNSTRIVYRTLHRQNGRYYWRILGRGFLDSIYFFIILAFWYSSFMVFISRHFVFEKHIMMFSPAELWELEMKHVACLALGVSSVQTSEKTWGMEACGRGSMTYSPVFSLRRLNSSGYLSFWTSGNWVSEEWSECEKEDFRSKSAAMLEKKQKD